MKTLRKILFGVAVLAVVAVALLLVFGGGALNALIKAGIESVGSASTQSKVSVAGVTVSPWSGAGEIQGLVVANPGSFQTPNAFQIGRVRLALNPATLFKETIVIRDLTVQGATLTFEQQGFTQNNLQAILHNIEVYGAAPPSKTTDSGASGGEPKSEKRVILEHFSFTEGTLNIKAPLLGERQISLPPIELHDIGKKSSGVTVSELVPQLVGPVIQAALKSVVQLGGKLGWIEPGVILDKTKEKVGEEVGKVLDALPPLDKDAGKEILDNVKKILPFKK
ncbi:MAG: AsmA family protein [Planctomycetota bacterium]